MQFDFCFFFEKHYNNSAKSVKNGCLRHCVQFCDCIGPLVDEYLVISLVYALIDYIILIFFLWLQADHTLGHKGLWFQADHRLNHIWPKVWSGWNHKLCFFNGTWRIIDWTIMVQSMIRHVPLNKKSLWFQPDHTLGHIWFSL